MERLILTLSLCCTALGSAPAFAGKASDLSEVVVADEIRWAFYEKAPASIAAAMGRATRVWCSGTEGRHFQALSEASAKTSEWLCGKPNPYYYRNVYITGARGVQGIACKYNYKYMSIDMASEAIEDGSCVVADSEEKDTYRLYLNEVNSGSNS